MISKNRAKRFLTNFILLLIVVAAMLVVFVTFTGVSSAMASNGVQDTWWNTDWHFRVEISISVSESMENASIPIFMNFSQLLEQIDDGDKTFDMNSIRVVEYDSSGNPVGELPYVFINDSLCDPSDDAHGWLIVLLTGTTSSGTPRMLYVYFDVVENGVKDKVSYEHVVSGWWEQFYTADSAVSSYPDSPSSPTDLNYLFTSTNTNRWGTCSIINYESTGTDQGNFPPYADPDGDMNYFGANWSGWLFVPADGVYDFETASSDGSWLFINDTAVVINNNGPNTSTLAQVAGNMSLSRGVWKITVIFHEGEDGIPSWRGEQACKVYWNGTGSLALVSSDWVTCFKYATYPATSKYTVTRSDPEGLLTINVEVIDASGNPLPYTNVTLVDDATGTIIERKEADANGIAEFFLPASVNTYTVNASYVTDYLSTEVINETTIEVTSRRSQVLEKTLTLRIADMVVNVYDLDYKPVNGARVVIFRDGNIYADVTTSASGTVVLSRFPMGEYRGSVSSTDNYGQDVSNESVLLNFTEVPFNGFSVILSLATINTTVVDLLGNYIEDGKCAAALHRASDMTYLDGVYIKGGRIIFENVRAEEYLLKITVYEPQLYGPFNVSLNATIENERKMKIVLPLGLLRINITDVNGLPMDGVEVEAESVNTDTIYRFGPDTTNVNGVCEFSGVLVRTEISGGESVEWQVTIRINTPFGWNPPYIVGGIVISGSTYTLNETLDVTDTVFHMITNDDPPMNASSALLYLESMSGYWKGHSLRVRANATGHVVLRHLPVGTYNITIEWLEKTWPLLNSTDVLIQDNRKLTVILGVMIGGSVESIMEQTGDENLFVCYWSDSLLINITFFIKTGKGEVINISGGALNWTLIDRASGNIVLLGQLSEENSVYRLYLNTAQVSVGNYTIRITGYKEGCPTPDALELYLFVEPVPTDLVVEEGGIYHVEEGTDHLAVRVWYVDLLHGTNVSDARVTLIYNGTEYPMVRGGSGAYECRIPVANLKAGDVVKIVVTAEKENFETKSAELTISITWRSVKILYWRMPLPVFLTMIGSLVGVSTIASTYFVIKRKRTPVVLRIMGKVSKYVNKGRAVPLKLADPLRSRDEIIKGMINERFESFDLEPPQTVEIVGEQEYG